MLIMYISIFQKLIDTVFLRFNCILTIKDGLALILLTGFALCKQTVKRLDCRLILPFAKMEIIVCEFLFLTQRKNRE